MGTEDLETPDDLQEETKVEEKEKQTEKEEVEEDAPTKKIPKIPTSITKDKIEKILFSWIASFILVMFLHILGVMPKWKLIFMSMGIASSIAILIYATFKVDLIDRSVLITGCDSGFGNALALKLESLGFTVIACCLSSRSKGAQALKDVASENLHVLQMDATKQSDIQKAKSAVEDILPEGRLWGLVNIADNEGKIGDAECLSIDNYSKLLDKNLFGTIAVTKAFLPFVRKAKGRVVNVSSIFGRMGLPMFSSHSVANYAIQGFTESLRQEMKHWEVDVIHVEPGNYITGTSNSDDHLEKMSNDMWSSMSQDLKDLYTEDYFNQKKKIIKDFVNKGCTDITPVVTSLIESLVQQHPQKRYQPAQWIYKFQIFVATHFPECVYDYIIQMLNKKQEPKPEPVAEEEEQKEEENTDEVENLEEGETFEEGEGEEEEEEEE